MALAGMRTDGFSRAVAVVLVPVLLAGCATRRIEFTSVPEGVHVRVGSRSGTTPCVLKVPKRATHAQFILAEGDERILALPEIDSDLQDASDMARIAVGGTLKVAGAAVAVVGFGVAAYGFLLIDDDENPEDLDLDDLEYAQEKIAIGIVTLLGGGAVYGLGEWIMPNKPDPVLHAHLLPEGEPVYEETGYGARRLKQVDSKVKN